MTQRSLRLANIGKHCLTECFIRIRKISSKTFRRIRASPLEYLGFHFAANGRGWWLHPYRGSAGRSEHQKGQPERLAFWWEAYWRPIWNPRIYRMIVHCKLRRSNVSGCTSAGAVWGQVVQIATWLLAIGSVLFGRRLSFDPERCRNKSITRRPGRCAPSPRKECS